MELSNAIITVIVALVMSLGVNAYIVKYILPRINDRIEDLEKHKAESITESQMRQILHDEREFMREVIKSAILEVELKFKD